MTCPQPGDCGSILKMFTLWLQCASCAHLLVVTFYSSLINRVHLIASVPGAHTGANMHKWGHMKLRKVFVVCREECHFIPLPFGLLSCSIQTVGGRSKNLVTCTALGRKRADTWSEVPNEELQGPFL